ncbi:transposase-like protein [Fusarium oxysporum f. sp. phaseoli]
MAANDTCPYHMYQQLNPSMKPVDIKARRMRCYGHTLNLVARAFLFGKDADSFELESDINSMHGLIEQDLDHWRTKGPIGEENEARRIPADDMLSSEDWRVLGEVNEILKPIYLQTLRTQGWEYLPEHFEDGKVFYSEVTAETVGETHLDAAERIATGLANFCERNSRPCRVCRLPARFDEDEVYVLPQRSQPTRFIASALPLHSRAECSTAEKRSASETSQKSTLPADHRAYIRASINNGWKKLNEYYDKLGESPLFAAAIILHPRFGISWLEATWVSEEQLAWVRDAKAGIKDYFTRWYDANPGLREETMKYDAVPRTMGQEDGQYTQWINSKRKKAFATGGSVGELERYLRLEPQDTQDAVQWWRDHRASFPSLSSFALDVFAIPAMASDCERQFSLAKLTLTSQRLSMGADTLEHVQCLKNWVRQGGVRLDSWVGS